MFVLKRFSSFICLFSCIVNMVGSLPMEPVCSSFEYHYKTLEAMLRTENNMEDMKKEMTKIQEDVTKKLQELDDIEAEREVKLNETSKRLDDNMAKINADNKNVREQLDVKLNTLEGLVTGVQNRGPPPVIAFSAIDFTRKLVNNVPTFTHVVTNIGNAYSQATGKFTCTVGGLYMFTLSVGSYRNDKNSHCRIQLNGDNVVISLTYHTKYTTSSNTVFLKLSKGDVVAPGGCNNVDTFYKGDRGTSFSGALISVI